MSYFVIGLLGLAVLVILLFMGMHIGIAMALVGFVGTYIVKRMGGMVSNKAFMAAVGLMGNTAFTTFTKDSLVVIPMFTLMGVVCAYGGISSELYAACYKFISRLHGGLAIATEIACAFFGAICGSATATTASMGKICLKEMDKYGYKRSLTCGSISAGGTLGILIPPSVGFILYGINAGVGVGKMFISGIIPGVILCFCYSMVVVVICLIDPEAGPRGPKFTLREKFSALKGVLPVILLFVLVLGGILAGWCSATEGGAVGAFGALIFMMLKGQFNLRNVTASLRETIDTTAMIFLIMVGSDILGNFFAATGIAAALKAWALAANVAPIWILLLCLGIYGILGCFVDSLPLIVLLTPIFLPIVTGLGYDPIWFGVLMVMLMELGLLTPPVGMCCYVMAGIAKDTPLTTVFKGTAPFIIGVTVAIIIVMCFPATATWLPSFMQYG